jgi:hypothetical protein
MQFVRDGCKDVRTSQVEARDLRPGELAGQRPSRDDVRDYLAGDVAPSGSKRTG